MARELAARRGGASGKGVPRREPGNELKAGTGSRTPNSACLVFNHSCTLMVQHSGSRVWSFAKLGPAEHSLADLSNPYCFRLSREVRPPV